MRLDTASKNSKSALGHLAANCAILFCLAAPSVMAEQIIKPKGVVELFTSQGCRSCPPADRAFEQLVRQGDVVALAYHVDYWNYLGWADTLASSENTERQYGYAKSFGRSGVYTPQAVLNGRDHLKGTDAVEINRRIDSMNGKGQGLVVPIDTRRTGDEHCYSDRHAEREEKHQSAENEKGGLRPAHRTLLSKEPYALRSDNAAI